MFFKTLFLEICTILKFEEIKLLRFRCFEYGPPSNRVFCLMVLFMISFRTAMNLAHKMISTVKVVCSDMHTGSLPYVHHCSLLSSVRCVFYYGKRSSGCDMAQFAIKLGIRKTYNIQPGQESLISCLILTKLCTKGSCLVWTAIFSCLKILKSRGSYEDTQN